MKIAILADTHFGIRNDKQVFLDSTHNFMSEVFFPYLEKNGIDTIIHLGDIFDKRKTLDVKTVDTAHECFFDVIREKKMDLHIILGNHDVYYRNTNAVNSVNILFKDSPFTVYHDTTEVDFDGTPILMCPWINNDNEQKTLDSIAKSKAQILMGHLELVGFQMDKFNLAKHGMDKKIFQKFDIVCSGHYHHKSTTGNINYLGSHQQFTWSDWDDDRGFHVFDTDTRELTFIKNPCIMFHKVTDLHAEIPSNLYPNGFVRVFLEKKVNDSDYQAINETLSMYDFSDAKFIENYSQSLISEDGDYVIDESEDTPVIITKYVDSMTTDINKNDLKLLLNDLYTNAMDVT